ncbi:hypothetical protein BH10PSE4_BH10PSE4_34070 [soil metagenome]
MTRSPGGLSTKSPCDTKVWRGPDRRLQPPARRRYRSRVTRPAVAAPPNGGGSAAARSHRRSPRAGSSRRLGRAPLPRRAGASHVDPWSFFATNDERTARRISDSLGTATEMRAMKNYAGHRLSPWLGHLMVSRQETARALLTPGEVMQLPSQDAVILVAGAPPIRARKIRYYADTRLAGRLRPIADVELHPLAHGPSAWVIAPTPSEAATPPIKSSADDGGLKQEPELAGHEHSAADPIVDPVDLESDGDGDEAQQGREMQRRFAGVARQTAMDQDDGIPLGGDS